MRNSDDTITFVREDTDEEIEVSYGDAIRADVLGCITLADGATARRACRSVSRPAAAGHDKNITGKPLTSDSLGFGEHQLAEMEADRVRNGHVGVEFVRDPDVPQFFQVRCSSRKARDNYAAHRGMSDKSQRASVTLSKESLQAAEEAVRRKYGPVTENAG